MKFRSCIGRVGIGLITLGLPLLSLGQAFADAPAPATAPGLAISEIKMTGDEFLVLQNNSPAAIPDLSAYWLYVYNKADPLTAGATTTTQQLPAAGLAAGQSVLLSQGGATCGAQVAAKLSVGFGDSAGSLQLLKSTSAGLIVPAPVDAVSWSSGADGDIPGVPSSTKDKQAAYYRIQTQADPLTFGWQPADVSTDQTSGVADICQLTVKTSSGTSMVDGGITDSNGLLAAVEPAATIISLATSGTGAATAVLPAGDVGLAAPQMTELLPNPSGTGTDGTDEFIELYNGNAQAFDLTGFTLQSGATTKHSYVFPSGTLLPAKSFVAFYSADTGLSLSNTSGQADLLDPFGTVLTQSEPYGTAKDGQAWALANGKWYWTTAATPNAANVVKQIVTASKATAKSPGKKSSGTVKGASTTLGSGNSLSASSVTGDSTPAPTHPFVLAAVAVLAVGYGVYEYRHDIANRFHQLRTNRAARRKARG